MPDDDDRMRQLETFGRVNNKLVETKQKWAREGRRLTGETATRQERRLPPGQDLVKSWPVLDLGVHPNVPAKDWTLQIGGKVVRPVSWGFDDLKAQPQAHSVSDIHCVTRWSRYDNNWDGVSLRQVMAAVEPLPEARFVLIKSYDGYTTNLPIAALEDDDVLLVHAWEGKALTREHVVAVIASDALFAAARNSGDAGAFAGFDALPEQRIRGRRAPIRAWAWSPGSRTPT